ncbi:unnamed protein product [Gadus morhua 'NCC']
MRRDPLHCQAGRVMEGQEVKTTSAVREDASPRTTCLLRGRATLFKSPHPRRGWVCRPMPLSERDVRGGKRLDSGTPFAPEEEPDLMEVLLDSLRCRAVNGTQMTQNRTSPPPPAQQCSSLNGHATALASFAPIDQMPSPINQPIV